MNEFRFGMTGLDYGIVIGFLASVLVIGAWAVKRASKNASEFFLSGRTMPWWLLGISMVACTFSCDTPNLVTDLVRTHGVSGNWVWWAFLITGMLTVFIYARLWRRSELATDVGFYEIRYSGTPAKVLRGFRAIYLGLVFDIIIMGTVSLAAIKVGATIFGLSPVATLAIALVAVGIYSTLGGLTGSIWADFYQFAVAMSGALAAAYFAVKACGPDGTGTLATVFSNPAVQAKMSILPPMSGPGWRSTMMTVFILPVAVQWWAMWYPGSEPGGGGFIAQRMLSAKDEKHSMYAVLFFLFLHYAVRSWPWLIVALASLVVFPDLASLQAAFPDTAAQFVKNDMAYPAMISRMPPGWLGLVAASLIAAYMSTIASFINWGSSYLVNDFYVRFVNPKASPKRQVAMGRLFMLILAFGCGCMALTLQNAKGGFDIILQVGAGTGLIYFLRWFWHRLNAWSEISAMIISFAVACFFQWGAPACGLTAWLESGWRAEWLDLSAWKLLIGVAVTTVGWLTVTFLTPKEPEAVLAAFEAKVKTNLKDLPRGVLCSVLGCLVIYCGLFGFGYILYGLGDMPHATAIGWPLLAVSAISTVALVKVMSKDNNH